MCVMVWLWSCDGVCVCDGVVVELWCVCVCVKVWLWSCDGG